jgi:hypothetical protein
VIVETTPVHASTMTFGYETWIIIVILMASRVGLTGANNDTLFAAIQHDNDTLSSSSLLAAIHPDWDSHIKDLERLLEVDLAQMERDAREAVDSQQQPNGTLAEDLLQIRIDIDRLVNSIKDVEEELGKTKHEIEEEEQSVQQMNAQMETERFLDGLHRGKLAVKVDYVTGQLVSKPTHSNLRRAKPALLNATTTSQSVKTYPASLIMPSGNVGGSSWSTTSPLDEVDNAPMPLDNNDDDQFILQSKLTSETVRQHIASHPQIKFRIKEEMEFLKSGNDPAVLTFDAHLMLNIVKLAMTASLFGLAAVFLKLPPTAGFLLGGMLIGPSCLDLLGEIHQVQTLAQFGAIFLLFEQGLLYAQTYSDDPLPFDHSPYQADASSMVSPIIPASRIDPKIHSRFSPNHAKGILVPILESPGSPSFLDADDGHDPTAVGFIILTLLVFVGLSVVFFTNVAESFIEAIMVSCTIAVCSTTIVSETLQAAHIADTLWGVGVLKMIVSKMRPFPFFVYFHRSHFSRCSRLMIYSWSHCWRCQSSYHL